MDLGVLFKALWPYLAVLYLADCIRYVRGGSFLLSGTRSGSFRTRGAGIHVAGLFPWSWILPVVRDPLLFTRKGVYGRTDPADGLKRPTRPDDLEFVGWDGISSAKAEGPRVLIDGRVVYAAPSSVAARRLTEKIQSLLKSDPARRKDILERDVERSMDPIKIQEILEAAGHAGAKLRAASTALFLMVFAVWPLSLLVGPPPAFLAALAVLTTITYGTMPVLWYRGHRILFPEERRDRLEELVVLILYPVAAMHAFGKMTARLSAGFDGVALMAALDPMAAREILPREILRARASCESGGGEDLEGMWADRVCRLEEVALRAGMDLSSAEPCNDVQRDALVCPLCAAAYRSGVLECSDCGVALRPG